MEDTFVGFEHSFRFATVSRVSFGECSGSIYIHFSGHSTGPVCIGKGSADFDDAIEFLREHGLLKRPTKGFTPTNRISEN